MHFAINTRIKEALKLGPDNTSKTLHLEELAFLVRRELDRPDE